MGVLAIESFFLGRPVSCGWVQALVVIMFSCMFAAKVNLAGVLFESVTTRCLGINIALFCFFGDA